MLVARPPYYGSGNAAWRAMLAPITQSDIVLRDRLKASGSSDEFTIARAWRSFAVQCVVGAVADGVWGDATDAAVRSYQHRHGLIVDGIVGKQTQDFALQDLSDAADRAAGTPSGAAAGFAIYEGAGIFVAVNWYSPSADDQGVDCGPAQWRIKGPPFTMADLKKAFNPRLALAHAALELDSRRDNYDRINQANVAAGKRGHKRLSQRSLLEVSALYHNAPFLALQIINNGGLLTPDAIAGWTVKSVDSQGRVTERYTHREWRYEYPRRILQFT